MIPGSAPPTTSTAGSGAVLLLVDDEPLRELFAEYLRDAALTVVEATQAEALAWFEAGRPVVAAVVDVERRERDGWRIVGRLRAAAPRARIVALLPMDERPRATLPCDVALAKPLRLSDLLAAVLAIGHS